MGGDYILKHSMKNIGKWGLVFSVYTLFILIIDGYFGIGMRDPWDKFKEWGNKNRRLK